MCSATTVELELAGPAVRSEAAPGAGTSGGWFGVQTQRVCLVNAAFLDLVFWTLLQPIWTVTRRENGAFLSTFMYKNGSFCQDRLGTNVGKTQQSVPFSCSLGNIGLVNGTVHGLNFVLLLIDLSLNQLQVCLHSICMRPPTLTCTRSSAPPSCACPQPCQQFITLPQLLAVAAI